MRRDDVLRAAAEVFMDKGYGAASISAIAEHMGSTKGKLYYYYSSKYALYLDIHVTALRIATERCLAARDRETAPDRQLWSIVHEQAMINIEGSPMNRVAIQGLERYMLRLDDSPMEKLTRRLMGLRADFEAIYIEVIELGVREGVFPVDTDASLTAKWVLGVVNWMVIWASPTKKPKRAREEIARSAADFALAGVVGR
ncbi:TetR/AcrR family transcriptional regulator [soil metagenome]